MPVKRLAGKAISILQSIDSALFGTPYRRFYELLRNEIGGAGGSLLDVGCGAASPALHVKSGLCFTVGVDAHLPSILTSRDERRHNAWCCLDIRRIGNSIAPKSFDIVMSLDVIEHLPKEAGLEFLRELECIARQRVILFTPNGFLPQPATADNPHQLHVSGWTADEMAALGYRIIGINGWRPLRREYAEPRTPKFLTGRLALLSEQFFETRPRYAFQILCVREVPT